MLCTGSRYQGHIRILNITFSYIVSAPSFLNPSLIFKVFLTCVHLDETICLKESSDSRFQGQCNSRGQRLHGISLYLIHISLALTLLLKIFHKCLHVSACLANGSKLQGHNIISKVKKFISCLRHIYLRLLV